MSFTSCEPLNIQLFSSEPLGHLPLSYRTSETYHHRSKRTSEHLPLSMWTSNIFRSRFTFFPRQVLHRSLGFMVSPFPEHSVHTVCICWTIPGAIWATRICIPAPLHGLHFSTAPSLPPRPTDGKHGTGNLSNKSIQVSWAGRNFTV